MAFADLSHTIEHGMVTYPGLPGPVIADHLSYDASRDHYADGTEFHIGRIEMVANTGTYLDTPAHRWRDADDLAAISLERVADLPGIVVRDTGPELTTKTIAGRHLEGTAVLFDTGWSRRWGTTEYFAPGHPHVGEELATALAAARPRIVGIDSVNVDDTSGGARPAHSILLEAGILIVEHLTGLEALPDEGFLFSAVPVKVRGLGTFPVRAYARW